MFHLPNALIIVGTNRNAGKTTLAEMIIRHFSDNHKIIGLKISPHFHQIDPDDEIIEKTDDFLIIRETKKNTGKDSSRMLNAGAHAVYYIQVWDRNIRKAVSRLLNTIDKSLPIVCESGWMRNVVEPGGFLIVNRAGNKDFKNSVMEYKKIADRWIEFDGSIFDFRMDQLILDDGHWKIIAD